ncbi:MAG: hypothetical protein SFW07_05735 [Gammaproteobacteria bacterium]|nr:hypothetical protein [Gammaproteobacteria bacterium]
MAWQCEQMVIKKSLRHIYKKAVKNFMEIKKNAKKFFYKGFHIEVLRSLENERILWLAKITNKSRVTVKEFVDSNREFVKLKALEWVVSENQHR